MTCSRSTNPESRGWLHLLTETCHQAIDLLARRASSRCQFAKEVIKSRLDRKVELKKRNHGLGRRFGGRR